MAELKTYEGSCHCGAVKYEVDLDLAAPVMACNCTMCSRAGWLLTFVTPDRFRLITDEGLADYLWNKHHIHHLFCSKCGIKSFARGPAAEGKPSIAINVRCLAGVDLTELEVMPYDGASA